MVSTTLDFLSTSRASNSLSSTHRTYFHLATAPPRPDPITRRSAPVRSRFGASLECSRFFFPRDVTKYGEHSRIDRRREGKGLGDVLGVRFEPRMTPRPGVARGTARAMATPESAVRGGTMGVARCAAVRASVARTTVSRREGRSSAQVRKRATTRRRTVNLDRWVERARRRRRGRGRGRRGRGMRRAVDANARARSIASSTALTARDRARSRSGWGREFGPLARSGALGGLDNAREGETDENVYIDAGAGGATTMRRGERWNG